MRATHPAGEQAGDLRRRLDRLDGLPLRAATAREVLGAQPEEAAGTLPCPPGPGCAAEIDPGWVLARLTAPGSDPLAAVAGRPWWPNPPGPVAEAIDRLWKQAVAASCAARWLAEEQEEPDPEIPARAALLHGLGRWALAAVAPERLAEWLTIANPSDRRALARSWLGRDLGQLGRDLAERWGCEPLVVDAAWLLETRGEDWALCAEDQARLPLLRKAVAWAERTPWALTPAPGREPLSNDIRLRRLVAEVQARCGLGFFSADVTPAEERLTRSVAGLRRRLTQLLHERAASDRFLQALADSDPAENPAAWSARAETAWASEPGVSAAEVAWTAPGPGSPPCPEPTADSAPGGLILPLNSRGQPMAEVRLRLDPGGPPFDPAGHPTRRAWSAWAAQVAERDRLARRLEAAVAALRARDERDDQAQRAANLEALAEFAAGAGHELNNPLAVVVGRAQLLLSRFREDLEAVRSLRAIITQAQRAHRILRDLIYVARPPAPRPRPCQPDEILRASLRDLKDEAEARGILLVGETREPGPRVWTDPDPLRHLADVFLRNALEATPPGGTVRASATGDTQTLHWTFHDNGRGFNPAEAAHLFDPFYCGRQAGRGLGLGLPRAARLISQAGGQLRWHSAPGQGATFLFSLPLDPPPA